MIRLERTKDYELVASIMAHPKLYPWIADDFYPSPENFLANDSDAIYYLVAWDDLELLGVCITHPINAILWEVHHALLPKSWGERAAEIARAFDAWLWEYTHAVKAVGFTPSCNRLALRFARRAGMTEVGRVTRAYQRFGQLYDLVIFEKARPTT